MNAPSPLAQTLIWLGVFCASLTAAKFIFTSCPELMLIAVLGCSTTLGGLLGSFVKQPMIGAILGFALVGIMILSSGPQIRD